jgi:serine/threonine-protein kinase
VNAGEVTHRWPEILPGGKTILFAVGMRGSPSYDDARIVAVSLVSGEQRTLIEGGTNPRYLPMGHLAFVRGATLFAVRLDLARLEVTEPIIPILEGITTEITGVAQFTFSDTGSLVYVPGTARGKERSLVWVSRRGEARALPIPSQAFEEPRLSPDGRQLAVTIRAATNDIWVYDLRRGTLTRLTFDGDNFAPVWGPDGKQLAFSSNRAV